MEDKKIPEEQLKKLIDALEENMEEYKEEDYEDKLEYIKIILEERIKMYKKPLKVIYKEYYEHLKDIGIIKEED